MGSEKRGHLYLTTDAGSTWRTITPGNIKGEDPIARIEEFVAFGPSHFWLVISDVPGNLCQGGSCRFGAVGYSADAGRHWAVSYLPGCFDCEVAASFVGTERGFVLGQFGASAAIYGTSDGGLSWDRLGEVHGVPGTTWTGLVFTSSSDGWLVGQGSGPSSSLVYATTDGGLSWARVPLPALVPGAQALGTGPLQFFGHDAVLPRVLEDAATGQDQAELDLSADGGAKWSQLTAPPWARQAPGSVLDTDGNLTFRAGSPTSWYLIAGTKLYMTHSGGRSWSSSTPGASWSAGPFQLASVDFVTPSVGWAEVLFNSCGGLPRQTVVGSCPDKVGLAATTTSGSTWRLISVE